MPRVQLVELFARALGVIDEARIEFGPGFNVITGETGAGKTLLLGALELCLGAEASSSRYALTPETRAVALFTGSDGSELLFSRESSPAGRLRATLDGAPSSAEILRRAASAVIVIHGQHDSLALRSRSAILRIVDTAGAVSTSELDDVRQERAALVRERADLGGDASSRERERDFLVFQCQELSAASIEDPHELHETLEELTRLSTLRDAQGELLAVIQELDGDGDHAVLGQLARCIDRLPRDAGVDDLRDELSQSLRSARESVHQLTVRSAPEQFDPQRIDELESRVTVLQQLARKYGGSLLAAMTQRDAMLVRIEELANAQNRLDELDERIEKLSVLETELAAVVRRERDVAATALTSRVQRQLPRVALTHATLRFVVDGRDGSDAQILFAPNPGWPEGPLQSLASGGELSRVLLALSLETVHDDVVAVFDEVDAGVGGQVAQQIGDCLRELGDSQQVVAVTHLASVAAKAAHHFVIEKVTEGALTRTRVHQVRGDDRVREIARMLAGDARSDEADALARRMLDTVS
jgi:DNA repair protein RecN (Recombination protein N)